MSIRLVLILLSIVLSSTAMAESYMMTIGETKGRLAQHERAGGYAARDYRLRLEAYVEGLRDGYMITAERDKSKYH